MVGFWICRIGASAVKGLGFQGLRLWGFWVGDSKLGVTAQATINYCVVGSRYKPEYGNKGTLQIGFGSIK